MDPTTVAQAVITIAGIIDQLVKVGPTVIKGIEDAKPFAEMIVNTLLGQEVTTEQLSTLEAELDALSAKLQAELPPEGSEEL